ncbi:MAG TPA: DUF72 domain-containing protein [Deltaproteobacteria bacterium]|nr:DUF72 domain-containing protein [Deltaproteobacteria bacterium]
MRVAAGTSGFAYKEWKGVFYPADLPSARMLRFYAGHFSTVEINHTFYRLPRPELLEGWAEEVPAGFSFALKAPRRITHVQRLAGVEDALRAFERAAQALGTKRGPTLYQLPPYLRKDATRLRGFLELLPAGGRVAFEFRHPSWFDDEVYGLLREHGAALCLAEADDFATPIVSTAAFGYLRLRCREYSQDALRAWSERLRGAAWTEAWVFFKHDDAGTAPRLATELARLVA